MRIETLPLILGILVALLGIGIIFDAWTPDAVRAPAERRRRPRVERHRNGEALIGLGVLALAAAFIGRDSWRYSVLVVIIGAVFLLVGALLNGRYVRELFVNRGPLRRRDPESLVDASPAHTDVAVPIEPSLAADSPADRQLEKEWDGAERRKTPRDREPRRARNRGKPEAE